MLFFFFFLGGGGVSFFYMRTDSIVSRKQRESYYILKLKTDLNSDRPVLYILGETVIYLTKNPFYSTGSDNGYYNELKKLYTEENSLTVSLIFRFSTFGFMTSLESQTSSPSSPQTHTMIASQK